jgi:hypothetical protein
MRLSVTKVVQNAHSKGFPSWNVKPVAGIFAFGKGPEVFDIDAKRNIVDGQTSPAKR